MVDLISIGVIALTARKGKRRGPAREIYRLIRLSVALTAGCGLYRLTHGVLKDLLPAASGLSGFLIYFAGAFSVVRLLKTMLIKYLDQRFENSFKDRAGLISGGLRGGLLVISIATAAYIAPVFPWKTAITEASWIGQLPRLYLPEEDTASHDET